MQVAVLIYNLCCGLRVLIVALHNVKALAAHLSLHTHRALLISLRVQNLYIHKRIVAAHSGAAALKSIVHRGLCHARRCLRQSIHAGNGKVHLIAHLTHKLHRAEAARHDTCAQAGEVKHWEHRVVQLRYEHGRHTIHSGAALLMYGGKHHKRVKLLHHNLSTAVCKAVHCGKHHTKTVEQRYAHAEFVLLCELHVLTSKKSVISYIVVG